MILLMMALMVTIFVNAQADGKFSTHQMKGYTLHIYNHDGKSGDQSFIVEGPTSLVAIEVPLTKPYGEKFQEYINKLGKPVVATITDYDIGGDFGGELVMVEGMKELMQRMNMVDRYKQSYGDKMMDLSKWDNATVVNFGGTKVWDGIAYRFEKGPAGFFQASTLVIGNQVGVLHADPSTGHISPREVQNADGIGQAIANDEGLLKSGAKYFISDHGDGLVGKAAVKAHIKYLKKVQAIKAKSKTADEFVAAMKKAFPGRAGEENLAQVAENLYK